MPASGICLDCGEIVNDVWAMVGMTRLLPKKDSWRAAEQDLQHLVNEILSCDMARRELIVKDKAHCQWKRLITFAQR
jgi:hypothetical protein